VLRLFSKFDFSLIAITSLLVAVSLLVLYSLSITSGADYFLKQCLFATAGFFVLVFVAFFDYRYIQRYSTLLYFGTMAVLLGVLVFGTTVRGTAGWISFGIFQVQPVEFSKITLIIFLASFISKKKSELGEWARVIASLILSALLIFLVLKQPDRIEHCSYEYMDRNDSLVRTEMETSSRAFDTRIDPYRRELVYACRLSERSYQ